MEEETNSIHKNLSSLSNSPKKVIVSHHRVSNKTLGRNSRKPDLKEVFAALNIKPIVAELSSYKNSTSTATRHPLTRRGFWPIDPSLAILGIASLGSISLFSLPFFMPKFKRRLGQNINSRQNFQGVISNAMVGASETIMSWVEKYVEELPSLPRLNAQECLKRSVCEAYNQPRKYGIMGFFLQLLFPPYTETDEPDKISSQYQLAARYGRQNHANCSLQYDGCMVNFLEIFQTLGNMLVP